MFSFLALQAMMGQTWVSIHVSLAGDVVVAVCHHVTRYHCILCRNGILQTTSSSNHYGPQFASDEAGQSHKVSKKVSVVRRHAFSPSL